MKQSPSAQWVPLQPLSHEQLYVPGKLEHVPCDPQTGGGSKHSSISVLQLPPVPVHPVWHTQRYDPIVLTQSELLPQDAVFAVHSSMSSVQLAPWYPAWQWHVPLTSSQSAVFVMLHVHWPPQSCPQVLESHAAICYIHLHTRHFIKDSIKDWITIFSFSFGNKMQCSVQI